MAAGDIGPVIGTGIFDAVRGIDPSIVHIFGDVYAVAYKGPDNDGWLYTFTIDSAGVIGAVINTLEFDAVDADTPCLIHVTGNIFAIAYLKPSLDDGIVKTFTISPAGVIGAVATFTFDAVRGREPDIIHIFGDVYAIVANGAGDRGLLYTITIDNVGNIGAVNTLVFDIAFGAGHAPHIIHIDGDVYAIAYTGQPGDRGALCTVTIDNAGNIGAIASFQYDTWSNDQRIVHVYGEVYAIAYTFFTGALNIGRVSTVTIDNAGNIGIAVVDSFDFDATQGVRPDIIHISRNIFAIPYRGADDDGYLITLNIANNGTIGAILDTLEFDDTAADYPQLIHVGSVYAVAYSYMVVLGPGYVKTMDIQTFTLPTATTDPATSVINNAASLNGTLDDDGGESCDCGFEYGETPAYGKTTPTQSRTTGQTFDQTLYPLNPNTTYYFRAFATNSVGTSYGAQRSFTTPQVPYYESLISPQVQTNPATLITEHTAKLNGVVVEDGGVMGAVRFQWGLTTEYGNNTSWQQGYGKGDEFFVGLNNLAEGQGFHFRAQFRVGGKLVSGSDMVFNTLSPLGPVTLVTDEILQLLEAV